MNQRDDARQFQVPKSVIADCNGRFRGQTFVPVIGMQPVADFDFIFLVDYLMKKAAVADQFAACLDNNCKLRR